MDRETPFIEDISLKDMQFGLILRSTVDKGILQSITPPILPPPFMIVTAADIPGKNLISLFSRSMPLLAGREISYRGQPVALLCGPDPRLLKRYAEKTVVSVERSRREQELENRGVPLLAEPINIERGDMVTAESATFQTMEAAYSIPPVPSPETEPAGAVAYMEKSSLVVTTQTGWLFLTRKTIASVCAMPEKAVIVRIPEAGVVRDPGIWNPSMIAAFTALLCVKSGKPVKVITEYREISAGTLQRTPTIIKCRTGLSKEGDITSSALEARMDTGGYPILASESAAVTAPFCIGPYRGIAVRAAVLPSPSYAPPLDTLPEGMGIPEAFFAVETHVSRIAELSLQDPLSWRKANLAPRFPVAELYPSWNPTYGKFLLDTVTGRSDFRRKYAAYESTRKRRRVTRSTQWPLRGIGLAMAYYGTGFFRREGDESSYSVKVRLEEEERVFIATSFPPSSPGTRSIWKKIASEVLGIAKDRITILQPDSSLVPDSGPRLFSRGVELITEQIYRCCQGITRKRFRSPLPIEITRSVRKRDAAAGIPLSAADRISWGAGVVEVEIDPVTYACVIKGIWLDMDCGRILDTGTAAMRAEAEVFRALSWCAERTGPSEDPLKNTILGIPGPRVAVSVKFRGEGKGASPGGMGELPMSVIPSAFISAISQATGCYFDTLPVTPEVIASYLEAQ